jgi:hypothetical protein
MAGPYACWYNFDRVTVRLWEIGEIVKPIEEWEPHGSDH